MKVKGMLSSSEFFARIEEITSRGGIDYIDAVIDYCAKNNIEIETAAAMIKSTPTMKNKIQIEAENLNILERTARLPIDE